MDGTQTTGKRVAVVGGGISGLAAIHRLHELDPSIEVTLYEAGESLGGVLQTVRQDGFLIERGADNFITNVPWGLELCRRIGFEDQLLETNSAHRQAFVVSRGRLRKIPEGFVIMAPSRTWPIISTPILSPLGKLRMACEYFLPGRPPEEDESLASFVRRRFGAETYDRLVQPLIGGIYTGDPEKLSVLSTMPRFVEMERKHGSLIRAIWKQAAKQRAQTQGTSGARYSMFVAPRDGMSSLLDAIVDRLPQSAVRTNTPVERLTRSNGQGWTLTLGGSQREDCTVDAVILASNAAASADLVADLDGEIADTLRQIPHASCSIVSLAYDRDQIGHAMDGFGFVVPAVERRQVISGSFSSVKYPGRAPDGQVLVRAFIGGQMQAELADLPDAALTKIACDEMGQLMSIRGKPKFVLISRYSESMPQYYVGHIQRIAALEERAANLSGLYFTGNAFGGVGMPFCIRKAEQAAEKVLKELSQA
jgi:oxygen-dependent protoporphyrinogen oxidase